MGGVLTQGQEAVLTNLLVISLKKLNHPERRYSATDKEALAVVLACRHFHHYLWGNRFTIFTYHQPLTSIFKRKTKSPRMNRWILEMREYNYEIHYVKGKDNVVADQLSRPVHLIITAPDEMILGLSRSVQGETNE